MALGVLGPTVEALKSVRDPLSAIGSQAALVSLVFRPIAPVRMGPGAANTPESERGTGSNLKLSIIEFDAVVSEAHNMTADVTMHPVENGSNITDHIREQPKEITLNGIVSGHPIKFLASLRVQQDPVKDAYQTIRDIMEKSLLVDVVTTLTTYESMAVTSVSISRDAANGNILNASLSLREVRIVNRDEENLPKPANASRAKEADEGTKPPKEAPVFDSSRTQTELFDIVEGGLDVNGKVAQGLRARLGG